MRDILVHVLTHMYAKERRKGFRYKDIAERVDPGYTEGRVDFPMEKRDRINNALLGLERDGYIILKRYRKEAMFTLYGGEFCKRMEDLCLEAGIKTKDRVRREEEDVLASFLDGTSPALSGWIRKEQKDLSFASAERFDREAFRTGLMLADAAISNVSSVRERDFAKRVTNDTKSITPPVRRYLEKILQACADKETLEEYAARKRLLGEKAQILPLYGVIRTPQYILTQGDMDIHMADGAVICTRGYPYAFSSEYIEGIRRIDLKDHRVLTIENKTTYEDCHEPGTTKIYTGGFLAFPARELLAVIYASNPDAQYRHWSDIDGGGIRIFRHVRQFLPTAEPYRMDVGALREGAEYTTRLTENDRKYLLTCKDDTFFGETVKYMLEHDTKLEQESLCLL